MDVKVGNVYKVTTYKGDIIHYFADGTIVKCTHIFNTPRDKALVECYGESMTNGKLIYQTLTPDYLEELEEDKEEVIL